MMTFRSPQCIMRSVPSVLVRSYCSCPLHPTSKKGGHREKIPVIFPVSREFDAVNMRCDGRVPFGLPCLAEPIAQRQIPKRRSGRPAGEGQLPCQRPDLRRTACLERPFGRRRRMRSAPDRAVDAPAGLVPSSVISMRISKRRSKHTGKSCSQLCSRFGAGAGETS
jgi:hypothetical protein